MRSPPAAWTRAYRARRRAVACLAGALVALCPVAPAVGQSARVYVRRIEFTGVAHVNDEVLRRELLQLEGTYLNTVALDRSVRILKVTGFAERRGDGDAARLLCEDITPILPPRDTEPATAERDPGSGRPTKQERRVLDRLMDRER